MEVIFPLDKHQRYFMFRQMIENYSLLWIDKKDYKLLSYYKKQAAVLMAGWGALTYFLSQKMYSNPETFYKQFLLTKRSFLYTAFPFVVGVYYTYK